MYHDDSQRWYKLLDERRASARELLCSCHEYAKARLSCLFPFASSLLLVKWQDKSTTRRTDNIGAACLSPVSRGLRQVHAVLARDVCRLCQCAGSDRLAPFRQLRSSGF